MARSRRVASTASARAPKLRRLEGVVAAPGEPGCVEQEEDKDSGDEGGEDKRPGKRSRAGLETAYIVFISTHFADLFSAYLNFEQAKTTRHRLEEDGVF